MALKNCNRTRMANPNPHVENIVAFQFQPEGEESLSKKPVQVRVPQSDYDKLMRLPKEQRLVLLRKWIRTGLEKIEPSV
jgi:hypothetical protein